MSRKSKTADEGKEELETAEAKPPTDEGANAETAGENAASSADTGAGVQAEGEAKASTSTESQAGLMYTAYCAAVGGKAFNGDPLPAWQEFRADPSKQKQSDAWVAAALAANTQNQMPAVEQVPQSTLDGLNAVESNLSKVENPTPEQKEALIHVQYALRVLRPAAAPAESSER